MNLPGRCGQFGCLLLGLPILQAQVTTATLYGRVEDTTGGVIAGAKIRAEDEATGGFKTATANELGQVAIPYIPVGTYRLTVQAPGFKLYEQKGLALSSGQAANLVFRMEVGAVTESVEITASAPLLNTVNAEQDINLNNTQIRGLPMRNRDITSILDLGTGAASNGTTISLNGLPPRGFSFSVDGVNAVPDSEFASISAYQNYNYVKGVSVEAVQEVEVSKNIFSAEIANTLAGNVNIITKGGSNQYHGSAFEQYQAGGLNANNHLLARKTSLVFHQFGGSFGGPIRKNKLFYFGTFEGYRRNAQRALTGLVPSNWIRQQAIAAIPESKVYWEVWPTPTGAETAGDVTAFHTGTGALINRDNTASARSDYHLNDTSLLTVRYTRGRPFQRSPRLAVGNPRDHVGLSENVSATFHRVWTPALTSESRFGYNRADLDRVDLMLIRGIAQINGAGLPSPDQSRQFNKNGSTSTFEQNFASNWSRHSVKFGGLYQKVFVRRILDDTPNFNYSTVVELLANHPRTAGFNFGLAEFQLQRWQTGYFFQDDVRLRPNLTINLGVRWDYDSVPTERDGRIFNRDGPFGKTLPPDRAWKSQYTSWSPRFGFAWSPGQSRKTSVRGGVGVFYIPHNFFAGPVEIVRNDENSPAEISFSQAQAQALRIKYPFPTAQAKTLAQSSGIIGGTVLDPNWRNAYSIQYTLGVQRELTPSTVFDVAYVGTRGVKLIYSPGVNRADRVTGAVERPDFTQGFRYYQSADSSSYHGLQTSLKQRLARLQFHVNYTWASNLSYYQGDLNCCGGDNEPWSLNDLTANRAPTSFHVRQRFVTDFVYDLPAASGWQGAARKLLGGWQIGGVFTAQTGTPLAISQGSAGPGQRPDILVAGFRNAIRSDHDVSLPDGTYQYLATSAFVRVPTSPVSRQGIRPGTLGRNQVYGPGFWALDSSLLKNVPIHERHRIQFRLDLFNALNHTNFDNVQSNIVSGSFGRITSTREGRTTQLSIRYDF